jgi:hypothetical protein
MRKDVAFASQQFEVSERRACKLMGMDRGSYRYEPRPDRNAEIWPGRSHATDTGDCTRCWCGTIIRSA